MQTLERGDRQRLGPGISAEAQVNDASLEARDPVDPVDMSIDRESAVALVSHAALPVRLGDSAMLVEEEGRFRIRRLEVDRDAMTASARPRSASWMPVHHYAAGRPTGDVVVEAESRAALADVVRTMEWPSDW